MHINIVPYDAAWASQFQNIKASLESTLVDIPVLSIEHIGSTSVPDLAAKPIIDIDVIVIPRDLPATCHALSFAGYTYNPEPRGMDRMSFRFNAHLPHDPGATQPTADGEPRRAVYVNMPEGVMLRNHLAVRQVLLQDAALREEYGRVKLELSAREFESIGKYGVAKNEILRKILARAEALSEEDWKAIVRVNDQ